MDRKTLVYRGNYPSSMICDQELRVMPNGDWVIIFMTGGDTEPALENYVALCRSKDKGATWSRPLPLLRHFHEAITMTEVIVHNNAVILFLQLHDGRFGNLRNVTITSYDSGYTWGEPESFAACPRRTFIRNLTIMKNGDWFLPLECFGDPTGPVDQTSIWDDGTFENAFNSVLISKDEGKTWNWGGKVTPAHHWAENNIVELSDGRLVMLIRFGGQPYLYRSESADWGKTWTTATPTKLFCSDSKIRIIRLNDGRFVMIHATGEVRCPLSLSVSDDDLQSWSYTRVLTDFPGRHSYPGGFVDEKEGVFHFAYDYNRHDLIYWGAKIPAKGERA